MKPERILESWRKQIPSSADWAEVEKVLESRGFAIRAGGNNHPVAKKGAVVVTISKHYDGQTNKVGPASLKQVLTAIEIASK